MDKKLSEKLSCWRAERPDEWTMDEFIRDSISLEAKLEETEDVLREYIELATWNQSIKVCPHCKKRMVDGFCCIHCGKDPYEIDYATKV